MRAQRILIMLDNRERPPAYAGSPTLHNTQLRRRTAGALLPLAPAGSPGRASRSTK